MRALLTGGGGMLGGNLVEAWNAVAAPDDLIALRRADVDLRDPLATARAIGHAAPDVVIHTAAYVGGIGDKTARPLPYLLDNVRIDASVLDAVVATEVPNYVYMASAAAYPAGAPNPISEDSLFGGPFEGANEGYGLAKLTGLTAVRYAARQTGRAYRALLPSNLYGPGDSFDPRRSHLIAATLYKAHQARTTNADSVSVWGDGTARREFTYAPDLARWIVNSLEDLVQWPDIMNVGAGADNSIREFYEMACDIVGFDGGLSFDSSKPSGVMQRLIDSSRARVHGWAPRTGIHEGMAACYDSFLTRIANGELR